MRFQFRPALTVFAALGLGVLLSLGVWQLQRLAWKRDLILKVESRLAAEPIAFDVALARALAGEDMEYARVTIRGAYEHDFEAAVFGLNEGAPGAYVFTPLEARAADGGRRFVYVNRGFVPQELRAPATRAAGEVRGEIVVEGLFRGAETPSGFAKLVWPVDQPADKLWFERDPQKLALHHGIQTVPFYVDSSGRENKAPWPKGGVTRVDFPNRHLDYALTWFGLAAALAGVFVAFSMRPR